MLLRGSNGTVMRKQDSLCLLASPVQAYLTYTPVNPVLPSNPAKGWVQTPADGWMGQPTRLRRSHTLPARGEQLPTKSELCRLLQLRSSVGASENGHTRNHKAFHEK